MKQGIIPLSLTTLFIVLKLLGIVSWSWVWIFSPIWIPIAICLVIWLLVFSFIIVIGVLLGIVFLIGASIALIKYELKKHY